MRPGLLSPAGAWAAGFILALAGVYLLVWVRTVWGLSLVAPGVGLLIRADQ